MKRVAVLPWPDMPGCYLVLSGALKTRERYGDKWYLGHEEQTKRWDDDLRCEARITFTYVRDGIAAEWDGEYGPIQLWFKSHEGHKEGYNEAREHWLWPWAVGAGHWSQMAVDEAGLVVKFNRGDWRGIFGELQSWVESRLAERGSASGIEAATADETGTGSTEGESPTRNAGDAQNSTDGHPR